MTENTIITLTKKQVNELADRLLGTPDNLENVVKELFQVSSSKIDPASLQDVDDRVFECSECGWWCGIHDLADDTGYDLICQDCEDEAARILDNESLEYNEEDAA